ncbi:hypothetical protein V6N13_074545 [Hibiscus sabdariffa]
MVTTSGEWNWSAFQRHLPWHILLRIAALKGPVPSFPVDSIGWGLREDHHFSLKSAYECPAAKVVWIALIMPEKLDNFLSIPFRDWIALNLSSSSAFAHDMSDWDLGHVESWGSVIMRSKWLASVSASTTSDPRLQRSWQADATGSHTAWISWQPPDEGWIKANVDGARSNISGVSTCGGVLRDHHGCRQLLIASDSSDALKAISRGGGDKGRIAILRYILELCTQDWIVSFTQVSRDTNGVADRLSKMALEGDFQVKRLDEPPLEVLPMFNMETQSLGISNTK